MTLIGPIYLQFPIVVGSGGSPIFVPCILKQFEVDKSTSGEHDRLKERKTDLRGVLLAMKSIEKVLKVDDRHVRIHVKHKAAK